MDDWDFYGDAEDVQRMRAYLAERCGAYEEATDRLGGVHFLDGKGLRISFLAWGAVADALTVAPDGFAAETLGQTVTAIGPYAQLALKLGYLRCAGFHADKNERDVSHWLNTLSPEGWAPAHDAVFRRMWTRAEEIFRTPPSDIEASAEMSRLNRFLNIGETSCRLSS
ncbi:hypothetical protein V8J38_16330 [Brevundimonas olei]|uniref:Uncharacterized protein n=1 Tax=Brevundimonas olei TaxID=657642 RepID=A0ABZ2IAZ0_9CAUL